ncbi:MAG: hypothetical protein V4493_11445 [Pseudomonadota bacterium]
MIQHIWSVVSRESKIDAETNVLSINDIYEEITIDVDSAENIPKGQVLATPLPFEVTSTFYREDVSEEENRILKITVFDPEKNEIGKFENPVVFEKNMARLRTRIKSPVFGATDSGLYKFKVFLSNRDQRTYREVAEIPITVKVNIHA